ncbi:MAG: TlpA family protein disulfide reductase [Gammaproteobacteria bacterium]
MRITILLVGLIIFISPVAFAAENPLELRMLDGTHAALHNYIGDNRWLLVLMWATACSVCFKEIPKISGFHLRHTGTAVLVVGVALDARDKREDIAAFMNLIAKMPAFALRYAFEVGEKPLGTPT